MPNLNSAKKALRQSIKRSAHNSAYRKRVKSIFKEMNSLINTGKHEDAAHLLPSFYKAVDKAAKRNLLHENTAARKKALMARRVVVKIEKK